jgi:hypothetical protein
MTRLDSIAFRMAFGQSSSVQTSLGPIQHLARADSSFSQIPSAILLSLRECLMKTSWAMAKCFCDLDYIHIPRISLKGANRRVMHRGLPRDEDRSAQCAPSQDDKRVEIGRSPLQLAIGRMVFCKIPELRWQL